MAKIVVADDDADIRDLVVFKLQQSGHDVVPVGDGAAAVEACRDELPDLAVLDVMMPRLDGYELTRRLRGHEPTRSMPIILLTARVREPDVEFGTAAGADAYVTKPFSPQALRERVRAALGHTPTAGSGSRSPGPSR